MLDNQQVLEELKKVVDPATGVSILQAKRVADVRINENAINIIINDNGQIQSEHKADLLLSIETRMKQAYPEHQVHVHFQAGQTSGSMQPSPIPQVKNIIAVASGKGGVGKSTISTNLAIALKKLGYQVGILDADFYGPSIPKMLGLFNQRPQVKKINNQHKLIPLEAFDMSVMSIGFIVEPDQAVVLRGPRLAGIMKQFIHDCIWPELDFLIIDLPPGTGDIQLTMVQTIPVTGAVIVTTPQDVSVLDAVKAMNMFLLQNIQVPILGIVENMSWFSPAEFPDNKYYLFGKGGGEKLAKKSKTKLLAQVPIIQSVMEGGEHGVPASLSNIDGEGAIFIELAKRLMEQIDIRNELYGPTQTVRINQ